MRLTFCVMMHRPVESLYLWAKDLAEGHIL
jgi:hypothetical protein